jgi:hypothetical protein
LSLDVGDENDLHKVDAHHLLNHHHDLRGITIALEQTHRDIDVAQDIVKDDIDVAQDIVNDVERFLLNIM